MCNLASGGNYYINSLFFGFISFFGHVALFRIFYSLYPNRKMLIVFGAFLLPSALYFSSGIHKDCIVFTCLAVFSWCMFKAAEKFTRRRIALIAVCTALILFIRSHVLIAMVPASVAFLLARKKRVRNAFAKTYAVCIILVIILSFSAYNPITILSNKQKDFFALPVASSQLSKDTLQPTAAGLLRNTPQAIAHGFAEPLPWKFSNDPLLLLGLEMFAYIILFVCWLFYHQKTESNPILWYSVSLAIPLLLFAGYIVPNAGSIVRYRAIYLPYLLLPLLCTVKLGHIRLKNI